MSDYQNNSMMSCKLLSAADNDQITIAKNLISQLMNCLNISSQNGCIAMAELIVFCVSFGVKTEKDLQENVKIFCDEFMKKYTILDGARLLDLNIQFQNLQNKKVFTHADTPETKH